MIGLFNIGLGLGRTSTYPGDFASLGAAYWLGGVVKEYYCVTMTAYHCNVLCVIVTDNNEGHESKMFYDNNTWSYYW